MKLGIGILKTNLLDGIDIIDAVIGKEYIVNLHSIIEVDWYNNEFNHTRKIKMIWDAEYGGLIPLELLELRGCVSSSPERN